MPVSASDLIVLFEVVCFELMLPLEFRLFWNGKHRQITAVLLNTEIQGIHNISINIWLE